MCGRFSLAHTSQELAAIFDAEPDERLEPRYNIAPTQPVLIIREHPHREDVREMAHVVWGLIPPWAESPSIASKMINARSETAAEKPAFRHALKRRRCIIPASGFFEWRSEVSCDGDLLGKPVKQPYFVRLKSGDPLPLAGLWEVWHGPDGEMLESCSVLTTTANELMKALHDRMPVILPPHNIHPWLDRSCEDVDRLRPLMRPLQDGLLEMFPVSRSVNSPRNDDPRCVERLTAGEA